MWKVNHVTALYRTVAVVYTVTYAELEPQTGGRMHIAQIYIGEVDFF